MMQVIPRSLASPSPELQNGEILNSIFWDFPNWEFAMQRLHTPWSLQTLNSEMSKLNAFA